MPQLFVEQLTVIDSSLLDSRRGLVGESWIVDLELDGELDSQGMLFDFGLVKKTVKAAIDRRVDHKLLLPMQAPGLRLERNAERVELGFDTEAGERIELAAPACAVCALETAQVTAAAVEAYLARQLAAELPANVRTVTLRLRPERIEEPYYHYSHGLKKHRGQCQRIAHGHRSRLQIERDGRRAPELEREWARRWQDIYIGSREDVLAREQRGDESYYRFGYRSGEGEFELLLPARRCYLLDSDSTVEHIAAHLAAELGRAEPDARFRVRAFEGVGKGAVATG